MYCKIQKISGAVRDEKWWSDIEKKSGRKWETLRHNGVLFPPEYTPLPSGIALIFNGKPLALDSKNTDNSLHISAEEGAVFLAMKMEQDDRLAQKNKGRKKSVNDKVFMENFWKDWKQTLPKNSPIKTLEDFKKVDFSRIQKYISENSDQKKLATKSRSKEEKMRIKEEKEAVKDLYGYAVIDGVKISMGNYMIQPPGLYMGHGNHPLRGKIKKRIQPSDVMLNVSKTHVPQCTIHGKPCKWGEIVEDHDVTWIATWRNPITNEKNYVWLKREESHWVCMDDMVKFDKARNLGENIESVRKKYTADLSSKSEEKKQLSTSVFLLDRLAVRPGTDKDEKNESDTLGLTTLKGGNIKFLGENRVKIDFVGKSSIKFEKKFSVTPQVYANLTELCSRAGKTGKIFPKINATTLNEYLKTLLPNLTAKVFRTYKAGYILQKQLDETNPGMDAPQHEKKLLFDKANIEVAKALNHKNMTTSSDKVEKIRQKLDEYKEKLKMATTEKQKASAQKSIDIQEGKLEQASGNISLSTSKVNYIDSRIVVSWCKKHDVAIEKIYNKNQLQKFIWAMETPHNFRF